MDITKYKAIVVPIKTYELIRDLSEGDDRSITATLKRYFEMGIEAEAEWATLDNRLKDGGTPRLKRLQKDLKWFRANADVGLKKFFIIDKEESKAIDLVQETLFDICGKD